MFYCFMSIGWLGPTLIPPQARVGMDFNDIFAGKAFWALHVNGQDLINEVPGIWLDNMPIVNPMRGETTY